jgi:dihydrofolate reductase
MTKTQYYCACTVDGFIAESDDTLEWLTSYDGSYEGDDAVTMNGRYDEFYEGVGALVMGSATYEFVLGHISGGGSWPYAGKPTWVLTSRDLPLPSPDATDVHFAKASVREIHPQLTEAAGGRHIWVVGGGNVASQYADEGLLDELLLTVTPVALGEGKPLFDRRLPGGPMQLTSARPFDTGMVELTYEITR